MPVGSSFVFAKKLDITQKDINTVLDVLKYGTLFLPEGQLKTALSTSVKGADIGTDITYGVFALSAVNEMEFIDGVITQQYKRDADKYFNGVLDQHLSLFGYYKGVGFDIPKVFSGNITGPVPALFALHTFDVMDKTINIVLSFSILQREKIYDGLWQYFDSRRSNESHETAWEYATYGASWAIDSSNFAVGRSRKNDHKQQLETQFEALWDKWGPYTDAFGVTEEGRRLVGQEVESIVSAALEQGALAQEEPEDSFLETLLGLPGELFGKLVDGAYSDYTALRNFLPKLDDFVRGDSDAGLVNPSPQVSVNTENLEEIERIEARIVQISQRAEELEQTINQVIASDFQQPQPENEVVEDEVEKDEDESFQEEQVVLAFEGCADGQVNVNAADSEVLQGITFIGAVRAAAIVEERAEQPFYSLDDLARVYGIGEGIVQNITNEGLACVADPEQKFYVQEPAAEPQYSFVASLPSEVVPQEVALCSQEGLGDAKNTPILINEAAWMGTTDSANDEWVELKNLTASEVSLAGWQLLDKGEQIRVIFEEGKSIPANGLFVLERTDDTTIPEITADTIYTGSLSNTEETLRLFDENCQLVDEVLAEPDWPGGDNDTKKTLERAADLTWQTYYEDTGTGTPGAENSTAPEESVEEESFSKAVVINEIAWMGTSASPNEEWVELYNPGGEGVELDGWVLGAEDETPSIELTGTIAASSYFLLERSEDSVSDIEADQTYSGALLNDGETLFLQDSEGTIVDKVDAGSGWLAGDNSTKQSMERISAGGEGSDAENWANNNLFTHNGKDSAGSFVNGTPGEENSVSLSATTNPDFRFTEFDSITMTKLGSPYSAVWVTVPAGKTLAIEPGVRVEFENNRGFLTIEGTLTAIGKSDNGITFTSDNSSPWCGIRFSSSSVNSELDYVTIDKAASGSAGCGGNSYALLVEGSDITLKNSAIVSGNSNRKLYLEESDSLVDNLTVSGATSTGDSSAVYISGGSSTIQNSVISDSSIGIHSVGGLTTPTIQNNTVTGTTYPIRLSSSVAALSGNTATGNTYDGVLVSGGTGIDMTWQAHNLPYIVNTFTVLGGKTLTIQAGVEVQFIKVPSSTARIIVEGTLITQGTSGSPVVFTKEPSTSSWQRIWFRPTSTGSVLKYTEISFGGGELTGGALFVDDGSVLDLQNVTVQNSPETAIYSDSTEFTGSNISVLNNNSGFRIANGACPAFTGVTMSGNEQDFHSASSPSDCTSVWGD